MSETRITLHRFKDTTYGWSVEAPNLTDARDLDLELRAQYAENVLACSCFNPPGKPIVKHRPGCPVGDLGWPSFVIGLDMRRATEEALAAVQPLGQVPASE